MGKLFEWDKEKNKRLISERGISFEAVITYIEQGKITAIVSGQGKYKHQKQFIIEVNQYVYIVPFVEEGERIFLKTVIPSRKMTKRYLSGGESHEEI